MLFIRSDLMRLSWESVLSKAEQYERHLLPVADYSGPEVHSDTHQWARAQAVQAHSDHLSQFHGGEAAAAKERGDVEAQQYHTAKAKWHQENVGRAQSKINQYQAAGVAEPTEEHHRDWVTHYIHNPQVYEMSRASRDVNVPTHVQRARVHAQFAGTEREMAGQIEEKKQAERGIGLKEQMRDLREEHEAKQQEEATPVERKVPEPRPELSGPKTGAGWSPQKMSRMEAQKSLEEMMQRAMMFKLSKSMGQGFMIEVLSLKKAKSKAKLSKREPWVEEGSGVTPVQVSSGEQWYQGPGVGKQGVGGGVSSSIHVQAAKKWIQHGQDPTAGHDSHFKNLQKQGANPQQHHFRQASKELGLIKGVLFFGNTKTKVPLIITL